MALDDLIRALGDPTRREVVRLLAREGPMTAGELSDRFALAKSTMSGHFNVLRQAGLVVTERQGTTIVYSASLSVLEETMAAVMDAVGLGAKRRDPQGEPQDEGQDEGQDDREVRDGER